MFNLTQREMLKLHGNTIFNLTKIRSMKIYYRISLTRTWCITHSHTLQTDTNFWTEIWHYHFTTLCFTQANKQIHL